MYVYMYMYVYMCMYIHVCVCVCVCVCVIHAHTHTPLHLRSPSSHEAHLVYMCAHKRVQLCVGGSRQRGNERRNPPPTPNKTGVRDGDIYQEMMSFFAVHAS